MDHETALKVFLTEISENAQFLTFDYRSSSEYTIDLRCKVENNQTKAFYNEYAKQWITKFSKFTSTNWIVRTSYPHIQRMLFRKLYFCQRSQFNKKKELEVCKRNLGCKAKIDFKVRIMTRHTEKKDPLRKLGCNLSIFIQFVHSHNLFDSESLSYLKTYSGVDSTFCKYFREGMGPVVAKNFHNLTLLAKYGRNSKEVYSKATNPTLYHVVYLQGKIKGKEAELSLNEILIEKKQTLETEGFTVNIEEGNYIIISPFMKRVYSNFKSDNLLIDTTQVSTHFVTILYVATKIGALPIASAVHSTKTEEDLTKLFTKIKAMIEKETEKVLELDYIMATDLDDILNMTHAVTPRYAIISELWNDICKMPKKQRHKIMELISSMLTSETSDAENYYEELKKEYDEPLLSRIDQLWYDKQFSCDIFDNFYVAVRLIKQFLSTKCKSFSTNIMIDVLSNILENYWRQIVIAHYKNRELTNRYTAFLTTNNDVEAKDTKTIWFCDCNEGLKGEFCAHLIAKVEDTMKVDLNTEDIELLFETAGKDYHPNIEIDFDVNLDVKNEMEDDGAIEEEMDQTEIEDNNYYVEVKNEDSYDPLDNAEAGQSLKVPKKVENYKKALHTLNAEFYRLNRAFRNNPNESNIDTMMRLSKELSKIQPSDNSGGFEDNSDE